VTYWTLRDRLVEVLELLLCHHPAPFRVLADPDWEPTADEVIPMLDDARPRADLGVRVDGGESVAEAQRICERYDQVEEVIRRVGGWPHVVRCVRDYRESCREEWALLVVYRRMMPRPGREMRMGDGGRLAKVAERLGIGPDTVLRRRETIVAEIAGGILAETPDGCLRLTG
jgi:hypothetical protein